MPPEPTAAPSAASAWLDGEPRRRVYARPCQVTGKVGVQLWWVNPDGTPGEAWGHGASEAEAVADALNQPGVPGTPPPAEPAPAHPDLRA